MATRKRFIADLLFGVQIVFGLISGGSQFIRMLTTARGVNVSWFVLWEIFLGLNLILAFRAHRNQPSRVTTQTIASYLLWVVVIGANTAVMFIRNTGTWDATDTRTTLLVAVGVLATLAISKSRSLQISDPLVRGVLALFFKAIPQLALAYKISQVGGAGLAGWMILAGHVTILTRLGQLWFSLKEAGWDRNRKGSAISELANEGSWLVATLAWLIS